MRAIKNSLIIEEIKDQEENVSKSGIILSGEKQSPPRGKVLSIGAEVKEAKVGDIVYYIKDFARKEEINGEKITFIREIDIICLDENAGK